MARIKVSLFIWKLNKATITCDKMNVYLPQSFKSE